MTFGNLARLGALCVGMLALGATPAAGQAAARYQLYPLELVGYVGKALRVSIEMPCNGELYGFVARDDGKGTLKVAAAVKVPAISCTALPDPVELVVDYFDTTGFKAIAPMEIGEGARRVNVLRISDLGVVEPKAGGPRQLRAVYESKCGALMGVLVRPTARGRLGLAMVERPARGMEAGECGQKPQARAIRALDMKANYKVAALRERTGPLRKAFYLRLAEVQAGSVAATAAGVKLSYKRACNEAPVGIVLNGAAAGAKSVQAGMLVARYYNRACAPGEAAETWTTAEERDLALPAGAAVALIAPTNDMDTLRLARPVEVAKVKRKSGSEALSIAYVRACASSPLGAVYARDMRGKLAVGVLDVRVSGQCKSRPAEVSWYQPFISRQVRAQDLFPMRLSGAPSA